ncbi:MAG: hypothetical protein IPQ04_09555 [Saprospiraceae bacterium]|nr:hypothetical protein [Saprospiraceae bacterium]
MGRDIRRFREKKGFYRHGAFKKLLAKIQFRISPHKMIFINSEKKDSVTDVISAYLQYFGINFCRIDYEDSIKNYCIRLSDETYRFSFEYQNNSINLDKDATFFFRRGAIKFNVPINNSDDFNSDAKKFLQNEIDTIHASLPYLGEYINTFEKEKYCNKLINLKYASDIGMNIPNTVVTNSKKEAIDFCTKYSKVITKPIGNAHIGFVAGNEIFHSTGTRVVELEDMHKLDEDWTHVVAGI